MAKVCGVCGQKIGILTGRVRFLDGDVCTKCYVNAGYGTGWNDTDQMVRMRSVSINQWKAMNTQDDIKNDLADEYAERFARHERELERLKANMMSAPLELDKRPKCDDESHTDITDPPQTPSNIPPAKPGTWNCTCGRNHPNYVSSCVCGINKSDIKR